MRYPSAMRALRLILLLLAGLLSAVAAAAAPGGPVPCHAAIAAGTAATRADAMPGHGATPHHRSAPAAACGAACLGCATELPRPVVLAAPVPHARLPYAGERARVLPGLFPPATSPPPRA